MAAYVGYDAMYRDGIAQVMPGMFSQTVEFSDISYQSARKEARETAFTVMSSLFNYFPADSHVQLQVVNAPIPADEVGRKVFFEPGERAPSGLAEEYNRILNDKMREGVSNLVRHRYLTYAVGADDVDAAVPKLARIRGDVEQTLARIRCSSRALDGAERLELLQGQLRPGSRFEFSWDKLSPTSGARTKDFVMPSTLDFKPEGRSDCFRSDGRYGAVLAVRSFGSVIEETYLASIIDLPLPLNVTLHVQPIAQSEALALVKRQIDWMDKEIIDEQMSAVKKGYDYQILPPELRFSKEEAEELAHKYLKMVDLEGFAKAYPKELSGGMKQRVAIARAYAVNPKVLLMDEPFGALDAQTRTQLQQELLNTWEKEQKTCFFITHDVEEAIILAQRVVIMCARPGRVKEIVDIDIPYPRDQETKMSPRFLELKNHIWSQVYQEYLSVRK